MPGSGSASRLATSISRRGGRGAAGLCGAESAGGSAALSAGLAVDLLSGSSAPPPRIRSNLANGSFVAGGALATAGASLTHPSGALAAVGDGCGAGAVVAADDTTDWAAASVTGPCADSLVARAV